MYEQGVTWLDEYTGTRRIGLLMNSAYCPVTGRWSVLVAAEDSDGSFFSLDTSTPGVAFARIYEDFGMADDDDDDSVEEGEDE
jgi:hypothetical protein